MYSTKIGDELPIMLINTTADLTGASLDAMRYRLKDDPDSDITGTGALALVSSGPSGSVVSYTFAAGETTAAGVGIFAGEVDTTIGGKPLTVPGLGYFEFQIAAKI